MESNLFEMSYFRAPITNKVPQATVTLQEVAAIIGSPQLGPQTQKLRTIKDKDEARLYKGCHFPYVTPAGVFSYCSDQSLVRYSGLLCMDLDHVADVEALKRKLIADSHFLTMMAFRSPSGDGLKWFIKMDLTVCDHRTWFQGVRTYLLTVYDFLTEKMVDSHVGNLSRACFLCYDPEIYTASLHTGPQLCNFDPVMWAEKSADVKKHAAVVKPQPSGYSQPSSPLEELAKARATVRELMRRGANIADDYGDYLKLGFALANGLGTEGRELYHQLCSMSPKYRQADCERKWQECMRKADGRTTIATFYSMAKQAGIDLGSIAREYRTESIYNF